MKQVIFYHNSLIRRGFVNVYERDGHRGYGVHSPVRFDPRPTARVPLPKLLYRIHVIPKTLPGDPGGKVA